MIPSSWMNEWFDELARLTEKITGNKVAPLHQIMPDDIIDATVLKKNYDAIIKAYDNPGQVAQ